jgi:hypothetical protein
VAQFGEKGKKFLSGELFRNMKHQYIDGSFCKRQPMETIGEFRLLLKQLMLRTNIHLRIALIMKQEDKF